MKPPSGTVLALALQGRTFIPVGRQGKAWRAWKRPTHQCFRGQVVIELTAPDGTEWHAVYDDSPRPMVYRAPNVSEGE